MMKVRARGERQAQAPVSARRQKAELTFVALVTKVAVILFKRPAKRIARRGIICGGGVKYTVHDS